MTRHKVLRRIATTLRWIAGSVYVLTGLNAMAHLFPMPEGQTAASSAFFAELHASGFMVPLLVLSFLVGGALLLWNRTAPLGLVVLAPVIVVIPLYNWLLERQPFTSGPFVVGIEIFLAWYYWDAFRPLWNVGSLPTVGDGVGDA